RILKDVWKELLASKKEWQPSLSEVIEVAPSTSVALQVIPTHSTLSARRMNFPEELNGKETQTPLDSCISDSFINETKAAQSNRLKFWGQTKTVVLNRESNQSFGISIVGGRVEVSHKSGQPGTRKAVSGIFIKSVLPHSPAGLSNMMNMGDRVNNHDLREATHEQAVQIIKSAKNPVKFVVQSLHSFPSYQDNIEEENDEGGDECEGSGWRRVDVEDDRSDLMSTLSVPEVTTKDGKCEGTENLRKLSQKRINAKRGELTGRGIDMDSAAALPKRDDDAEEEDWFFYTRDKINRKYGNLLGDTILLKLDEVPHGDLGLSLASNRDRDRDRMIVQVVAVKSTCPLSVKIGDELLEVNGKVLIGLSHLNVSSIMRKCCEDGILELLLLRRFEALVTLFSLTFSFLIF
ncbi:unnamed protein product, partial [Litomosoides sigmodontis]